MTIEKHDHPTPAGGVRSEAHYHDGNFNPVDKDRATHVEILEFDEHDQVIFRTHAVLSPRHPSSSPDGPDEA